MVVFNYVILFATFVLVAIFIYIYKYPNKFIERNKKVASVSDYIQFIGVVLAVGTISIACIINIFGYKSSKFYIELLDVNGSEWSDDHYESEVPGLGIDDNNHLTFTGKYSDAWRISLCNNGNTIAEDISIRISIDGVMFFGIIEDFDVSNHMHGLGGYKYIVREYDNIKPNETLILPVLPLENAEVTYYDNLLDGFNMTIDVFSKDSIMFSQNIKIHKNTTDEIEKKCKYVIDEDRLDYDDEMFTLSMNKTIFYSDNDNIFMNNDFSYIDYRDYVDCESIIKENEYDSESYQRVYKYYLSKLNVYNNKTKMIYVRFATIYGRLYYISCSQTDIEDKIQNDIIAHIID